ncbi:MAG: hypothetical protein ACYDCQ_14445, partial [Dehalococcoidia bacterium]
MPCTLNTLIVSVSARPLAGVGETWPGGVVPVTPPAGNEVDGSAGTSVTEGAETAGGAGGGLKEAGGTTLTVGGCG